MKHRPTEADQLMIEMDSCSPALAQKLRDLEIRNFEELYRFRVQKESELTQEKKFFGNRSESNEGISSSSNI